MPVTAPRDRGRAHDAAALVLAFALAGCARGPSEASLTQADTTQCPSQVVEGIDVYSGTGTIDWSMVASSGRMFAFIKATQGNYDMQSTFCDQWTGAQLAGVLRSPYHFFDGTIDGVTQAQYFLADLESVGGLQPGDLPAMLDLECPTSSDESQTESDCEYTGDSGWVDTATLQQRALDWLSTVQQATGLPPIIYSYPSWFADTGVTTTALTAYPLFIASYDTCADVPAPWTSAVFWQYADNGTVPGISGETDEDRLFGSDGDLQGLTLPTSVPVDAGVDASASDAGNSPPHAGGGCRCATRYTRASDWIVPLGVALLLRRRRFPPRLERLCYGSRHAHRMWPGARERGARARRRREPELDAAREQDARRARAPSPAHDAEGDRLAARADRLRPADGHHRGVDHLRPQHEQERRHARSPCRVDDRRAEAQRAVHGRCRR